MQRRIVASLLLVAAGALLGSTAGLSADAGGPTHAATLPGALTLALGCAAASTPADLFGPAPQPVSGSICGCGVTDCLGKQGGASCKVQSFHGVCVLDLRCPNGGAGYTCTCETPP